MIRISDLIDRLLVVQTEAEPFDPEVRVALNLGDIREIKTIDLDGNGYVYIDTGSRR